MTLTDEIYNTLTPASQGLLQMMQAEAHGQAQRTGAGWAQVHEEKVGGLNAVQGELAELAAAGIDVNVSAGESDRMITMGVRLTRQQ